jgi:parallel beta-helix repeat protein
MKGSAFAIIISAMIIISVLPATAQLSETRGPRPEVVYGDAKRSVTLTFYIAQNDTARLQEILEVLQSGNVSEAVFFLEPSLLESNSTVANTVEQRGYTVLQWNNTGQYDQNYVPTAFAGILLSDRDMLGRTDKIADIMAFYNLALHSSNESVLAFTPSALPRFNATTDLLEEVLENGGRTFVFTDEGNAAQPTSMAVGSAQNVTTTPVGANTAYMIEVDEGVWDMEQLQQRYPYDISTIQTSFGPSYLINTTLVVGENAQLNISGENVLVVSPAQDKDRRIEVIGRASIVDSLVSSWDTAANAPDRNPYHQRPFIFVDGGKLDIENSTIIHMGFPLAGLSLERNARAAIMFHDSSNFTIANSTIAFNFDGIYARNSSNFQITGNDVYGNTRSGIDIRAGSHGFAMNSNHVRDNAYEGMSCTECATVGIAGNTVEHNKESGIKLFSHTNSTIVNNNIVKYNEFGIYLRNNATDNMIRNNMVTGGEEGITLSGSSINNIIENNIVAGNDVAVAMDLTSETNTLRVSQLNSTQAR